MHKNFKNLKILKKSRFQDFLLLCPLTGLLLERKAIVKPQFHLFYQKYCFLTYTVAPECEEKTASVNGVF